MSDKLQSVLNAVPPGYLVTARWLASQGIAYESFRDYVKRGWLERVARGVFRRPGPTTHPGDAVDWRALVVSMQYILGNRVHVGASTALALHGFGHHVPLGEAPRVFLYGDDMPRWLARIELNARLVTRGLSLFGASARGVGSREVESLPVLAAEPSSPWMMVQSSAERAILELIDEAPDRESLDTVDATFEALTNLRPGPLAELLGACKRVKTKRLFFVFADRHDHAWRKYVHPEDFDLGRGDRALVPGGALHPRYRIVVPTEYLPAAKGD